MPMLYAQDVYPIELQTPTIRVAFTRQVALSNHAVPIQAYVNQGRWLVDCACNNSMPVMADGSEAPCLSCGTVWTNVTFPSDRADIEAALLQRRFRQNQNWKLPETVADLQAENDQHAVMQL